MPKDFKFYLVAAALFIISISLGFFAGNRTVAPQPDMQKSKTIDNNLYSSQNANIRGRIDQINPGELLVTNLNNNVSGTVKVSERVVINTLGKDKPGSDLSVLEKGREVLIGLEMINGQYQAISIQYISPAPSLPKLNSRPATQSSQLQNQ